MTETLRQLTARYHERLPLYTALETRLRDELACPLLLEQSGANVYRIATRVKALDSFLGKFRTKGMAAEDAFDAMTDMVGARIVCLFPEDLEKVHLFLMECGSFVFQDRPIAYVWDDLPWISPETFAISRKASGYGSVHYLARLSPKLVAPNSGLDSVTVEIQVRTLMQEAWAALEHSVGYKNDVPERIRGYFDSAADMLGVLDRAFQRLKTQSDALKGELDEESSVTPEHLTLFSLKAFLRRRFDADLGGSELTQLLADYRRERLTFSELARLSNDDAVFAVTDETCRDLLGRPSALGDTLRWIGCFRFSETPADARDRLAERIRAEAEYLARHAGSLLVEALKRLGDLALAERLARAEAVELDGRQMRVRFAGPTAADDLAFVEAASHRVLDAGRMLFGPLNRLAVEREGNSR